LRRRYQGVYQTDLANHPEGNMSLLRGRVGTLLLTVSLVACSDGKGSPVAPSAPSLLVTSISPTLGDISGGTDVVLRGVGFTAGTTVAFGGTPATDVRVLSGTLLRAIAPSHAAGLVDVLVENPDGRTAKPSMLYRYVSAADGCAGCWDY
jgi:hypothetical protein